MHPYQVKRYNQQINSVINIKNNLINKNHIIKQSLVTKIIELIFIFKIQVNLQPSKVIRIQYW